MSKFRIVKTTAAKVYSNHILMKCNVNPLSERYLVQKKKLFGWGTVSEHILLSDAEEYVLHQKGQHPIQLLYKKALEKPDEIVGEY